MTTIQTPEQWGFGGVSLSTLAYFVGQVDGADDLPPLRGADVPFTGVPGARSVGKLFDGRQMTLLIVVMPQDASGTTTGTNRQQARVNMDAIKQVLGQRAQASLTRLMPDATTRTAQAECIAITPVTDPAGGEVFTILATFFLADPFFYGANVTDSGRTVTGSGMTWSVTHPGSVQTYKVQFSLLGAITNPQVTNLATGALWLYTGVLGGSDTLVLDSELFTAKVASTSVIGAITHSGAVPFTTVNPGANVFQITGSSISGAKVTTVLKVPYL